jgi:hypothetical protein
MKREPSAWGYNLATRFLGDINKGTWPSRLGSLESETVKCGYESRGTRTWKWLCWRVPAATSNDKPILSPVRILHKAYDHKCPVEGLSSRRTDWRQTASRNVTITLDLWFQDFRTWSDTRYRQGLVVRQSPARQEPWNMEPGESTLLGSVIKQRLVKTQQTQKT